ncbi:unnamed protein product [Rotaria sp. Silwood1]|nr:unnamed protein product [Rotaria sp. Silwood1]
MTANENINDDTFFDMKKKKKSKNRINRSVHIETTVTDNVTEDDGTINDVAMIESDYSYKFLINRAFKLIPETNPVPHRLILPPVQVGRIGTKRTTFLNFSSICALLKRQEKQLYEFFIMELGTTASIDGNHALIIKGRFQQSHLENVLREYVLCKTCHSSNTLLGKSDRLTMITCNICHSQYSVSTIKTNVQIHTNSRIKEN